MPQDKSDTGIPSSAEAVLAGLHDELSALPEARFADIFGSLVTGRVHAESDVDVAVYVDPDTWKHEPTETLKRLLEARFAAAGARTDLTILNDAGCLLRHRVLQTGRLACCGDDSLRSSFAATTTREYLDPEPLRVARLAATRERIRAGGPRWSTEKRSSGG